MEIKVLNPIEKEWRLVSYGKIDLGYQCGYYLLADERWQKWQLITGWKTPGLDPAMGLATAREYQDRLNEGLKILPSRCALRWDYICNNDDNKNEEYGQTRLGKALRDDADKLIESLSKSGNRRKIGLKIYSRYWFDSHEINHTGNTDWLNKIIDYCLLMWTARAEKIDYKKVKKIIRKGYVQGFLVIQKILSETMRLPITPLSWQELYVSDYGELHQKKPLSMPHLLVSDRSGTRTVVDKFERRHITSILAASERGKSCLPQGFDASVYLPAKKKYVGYLQIKAPGSIADAKSQLRYLFKAMAADSRLSDFKIITEVVRDNQKARRFQLERLSRNNIEKSAKAAKSMTVDVGSTNKAKHAIAARDALEEGESIVMRTACAIALYRNSKRELAEDFEVIVKRLSNAECERCDFAAEYIWLTTLPWSWHDLFTRPIPRLNSLLSIEAIGLMPSVIPRTLDKTGIEFIATEGFTPVNLDIIRGLQNLLIIATTRGGKSVLIGLIILKNFFNSIPTYVLDFPRPTDGSSTFSDATDLLKELTGDAFYFNTAKSSSNLIQIPDLTGLDNYEERWSSIVEFQVSSIISLIMGDIQNDEKEEDVKSLIIDSYNAFLARDDIQLRHEKANRSRRGEADYENVPTLHDYLPHFEAWFSQYLASKKVNDPEAIKAGNFIIRQLKSILISPIGKTIAQPTSFDGDPNLLVFALKNVSKNREAKILILSAYSALLRKAISAPLSCLIIDETPILWEFPSIVSIVERTTSNGLKWGCRVIISAQSSDKIYRSEKGPQILQTIQTKIVGYITSEAVETISSQLKIEKEKLEPYVERPPSKTDFCSYWHIKRDKMAIDTRFYTPDLVLAIFANNPDEQAARERIMSEYEDPISGLTVFGRLYANAKRNGIPMEKLGRAFVHK
ncbi:MAG: hypothetical protein ACFBSE_10850 [Prochloraceae cyanobacterium]